MRKLAFTAALSLAFSGWAWAGPVDPVKVGDLLWYSQDAVHYGNGGPFHVRVNSSGLTAPQFQTVCVEKGEYLDTPIYVAEIGLSAKGGGGGATGTPPSDPLSAATRRLFYEWRVGGATFLSQFAGADQSDVQQAIWHLEEEESIGGYATSSDPAKAMVVWALTNGDENGWKEKSVRVMVTMQTDWNGTKYVPNATVSQDLLCIVPEPATLCLAGLGLIGAAAAARKRRKS